MERGVGTDIIVLENRINPALATEIIQRCNEQGWKPSGTFGNHKDYRTSTYGGISNNVNLRDLDTELFKIFQQGTLDFRDFYDSSEVEGNFVEITEDEGYELLRYEPNQEYKLHYDYGYDRPRVVSIVLYLNNDYEGGELFFKRQDITIKPKAGDLVFFPSVYTHPHASLPIVSGVKYSIPTWCR